MFSAFTSALLRDLNWSLIPNKHSNLVAGELEEQLDDVLLGDVASRVQGRGEQLLVDMTSTRSCLSISI